MCTYWSNMIITVTKLGVTKPDEKNNVYDFYDVVYVIGIYMNKFKTRCSVEPIFNISTENIHVIAIVKKNK